MIEDHITLHKRHMACFSMLNAMTEHFNGEFPIECSGIKRVFINKEDALIAELVEGREILADDLETEQMEDAILEWKTRNPEEFQEIVLEMNK